MKESGINYFYNLLTLDTGIFSIMYTYEEGSGTTVNSISGGQSLYTGTLSSSATFWQSPGSGFFSGTTLTVANASGADSDGWTKIFVYEQIQTGKIVLFDSLLNTSGCKIGINDANKVYFETFTNEIVISTSANNLSNKNAIAVSYLPNLVNFNYYNFNSKLVESESYSFPFQLSRSDRWRLGGGAPYYSDYFISYAGYVGQDTLSQLFSGLYAVPTGYTYDITSFAETGITGFESVFVGETGVTGRNIIPGGDEGKGYFTGAFPTFNTLINLTGYLSTGIYLSGLIGTSINSTTGDYIAVYQINTGYASSFGMKKVQLFSPVVSTDIIKTSYSFVPFNNIYNQFSQSQYSGYLMESDYTSGLLNLYLNGLAQGPSGWRSSGNYVFISGAIFDDSMFFDLKDGSKNNYTFTGNQTSFNFVYSGQEIYLNGINLISGYDFNISGANLILTSLNTGITGIIFEYPIILSYDTGNFTIQVPNRFWRNTSNIYFNGIRQEKDELYIEGSPYDLLSGQYYNYSNIVNIYDNNNLYWE